MKVLGMHGELLEDADKSAPTQDFFFNNAPMIELTDIDTCLEIMELRETHFSDPAILRAKTAPLLLPNTNLVSMNFYTQSAFRFGELHGHTALFQADAVMAEKASDEVKSDQSGEILSSDLFGLAWRGSEVKSTPML